MSTADNTDSNPNTNTFKKDYLEPTLATSEKPRSAMPMEVFVDTNVEKAIRALKRKLIKEGLFKELKARKHFQKPCVKKALKQKEAVRKARKDEARFRKSPLV